MTTRVRGGEYTRSKIQGTPEYRDAVEQKVAEIRAGAPDNRVYPSNPWYNPPFDGDELRSDLIAEVICEDALAIVHGAARE